MRHAFFLIPLVAACASAPIPHPEIDRPAPIRQSLQDAPNIVLIMVDDLGLEAFGCYGGETYATPRIDALASQGMQFEHVYSQTLCTPSRVKLMTGRSNLRNYTQFSMLKPGERTFAHVLQSAGYVTGVFGKWQLLGAEHYGEDAGKGTHPRDAGFDEWCLWQVEVLGSRYSEPRYEHNGILVQEQADSYGPDLYSAALLEFAERHRERPFLAYYPMVLTHSPFDKTPDSPTGKQTRQQRFADMVAYVDQIVGRIEDGLSELGLNKNTVILFTTDNGTEQGIVSRFRGREVRGAKTRSTDAGIHVPLIVSWPGVISADTVNDDLIDFSDFLPTLAELGGAAIPEDRVLDGRSFAPQLRGELGSPREVVTIYSNPRPPGNERNPRVRLARDKRFKLYDDGRMYDCVADPDEQSALELAGLGPVGRTAYMKLKSALDAMPDEPRLLQ